MHETLVKEQSNKPLQFHQSSCGFKMCMGCLNFKFQILAPYFRSNMLYNLDFASIPPKLRNVRDLEQREENAKHTRTMKMWKHSLEQTWTSAPIRRVQKLINSQFESVIPAIIAANCGRTKY